MENVIDVNNYKPGSFFAQSLGSGLQQLAQQKMQQLAIKQQQNQTAQGLRLLLPDISEQQAHAIAQQSPETQQLYIKNALEAPQNRSYAEALFGLTQNNNPIKEPQPLSEQEMLPEQKKLRNPFEYQSEPEGNLGRTKSTTTTPVQLLNAKQATELAKIKQKQDVANKAEVASRFKETKETRAKSAESAKNARRRLEDLQRFEELEGSLDTPGYVEFLERSGLDIPALMTPESEEFKKIAANFLTGAKEAFGGRVSNYEVQQFLKTVPSLSQSPEGRKRVIANLKRLYRGDLAYNDAKKEIIRANGGVPPYDLSDQIDDRIDKKLDAISKQFKEDLKREVPKGQNRLITALQATLGSVASLPSKIVSKAGSLLGHAAMEV